MTRDERIKAAAAEVARAWADDAPGPLTPDNIIAALNAALADVGGLDGLATPVGEMDRENTALRADRDRLRSALRVVAAGRAPDRYDGMESVTGRRLRPGDSRRLAERALAESEAGS